MLENFSNTILAENFAIVCEKLSEKSIAQSLVARNNCSLITQVATVSHRIVLVLHSLVRQMAFPDQAITYYVSALGGKNKIVGKG
jgi:hypothetical protein